MDHMGTADPKILSYSTIFSFNPRRSAHRLKPRPCPLRPATVTSAPYRMTGVTDYYASSIMIRDNL